jgi:hypothetical protein
VDDIAISSGEADKDTHIHIRINNEPFVAPSRVMSGSQLIALAGAPVGNHLFLEVEGPGPDRSIRPDELVPLHSGMKFYDVPVGTFG